ncbi:MAG: hypothetical protein DRJ05_10555 [Bacteroidetes bacterium]|nr:MAG: hypothetical protein DRJ05_10555 [Bacteroidota bacterium]
MSHIKEQAVNLEIMAGIITSLGMIVIMANEFAGRFLIVAGMFALCILYIILCLSDFYQDFCNKGIVFLNYSANTIAILGMILSILKSEIASYVLITGMILLFVIFILNMNEIRNNKKIESWFKTSQLRIFIIAGLSILFFVMR